MKKLLITLATLLSLFACKSDAIVPEKLVGKWFHTNQVQYRIADGWGPCNTFVNITANPPIEFTAKGNYLRDGKPGAECCTAGNKFTVLDNIIKFSEVQDCPQMSCIPCREWSILSLDSDTLIAESCGLRVKYARIK
ncbi:hypothetical protein [Emticicia fontis]